MQLQLTEGTVEHAKGSHHYQMTEKQLQETLSYKREEREEEGAFWQKSLIETSGEKERVIGP